MEEFRISTARVPGRGTLKGYKEVQEPPRLRRASMKWFTEVEIERVEWLWYPYIPYRKLTMLGGDPGMGKSFISQAIAAAVSRGEALPGQATGTREPANVLMFAGEDDPSDTLKPRLISLDADLSRIAVSGDDIRLDADGLALIDAMIEEVGAKLFIIDPIVAYLGAKLDMNRSNEVRPMLKGLAAIAQKHKAAGLIVRHLRKASTNGSRSKDIYAGMGSIDFTAAVRSEMQVSESKMGIRYLNHVKTNIGPKGKSIIYKIEDDEFEWGGITDAPSVQAKTVSVSTHFPKEFDARRMIYEALRDYPNGRPTADIYLMAKAANISERTLQRAREGLVIAEKIGAYWVWKLRPEATVPMSREDVEEQSNG